MEGSYKAQSMSTLEVMPSGPGALPGMHLLSYILQSEGACAGLSSQATE